jgi:hypothetical protein
MPVPPSRPDLDPLHDRLQPFVAPEAPLLRHGTDRDRRSGRFSSRVPRSHQARADADPDRAPPSRQLRDCGGTVAVNLPLGPCQPPKAGKSASRPRCSWHPQSGPLCPITRFPARLTRRIRPDNG